MLLSLNDVDSKTIIEQTWQNAHSIENSWNELELLLEEAKTYVEVQNAQEAELLQLVDELNKTIEDRDETIVELTPAVLEIKPEQIGFYQPNDYHHQWEYYLPHDGTYHHGPVAYPYYPNYPTASPSPSRQCLSLSIGIHTPNHWILPQRLLTIPRRTWLKDTTQMNTTRR